MFQVTVSIMDLNGRELTSYSCPMNELRIGEGFLIYSNQVQTSSEIRATVRIEKLEA